MPHNTDWSSIPVHPSFSIFDLRSFGQAEIAACFAGAST